MHKELNHEAIVEVMHSLPNLANREQVTDLIINIVIGYNMMDTWSEMSQNVEMILDFIDRPETETLH
jgi:hypothetical protein